MKLRSDLSRTLGVVVAPFCALVLFLYTTQSPLHVLEFPDPDFSFLFSSLTLLHGEVPRHVEYPGTPLQALGMLVMFLRYLLAGTGATISEDFFLHPVEYQQTLLWVLFSFLALAQIFCGRRLLRIGVPLSLTIFAQMSPFLVWDGVVYLGHSSPEILVSSTCLLLIPFLVEPAKRDQKENAFHNPIAIGMLIALIVSLKASSLPLLVLVFLLDSARDRIRALVSFCMFAIGFTIPAWPNLPAMLTEFADRQSANAERSLMTIATNASDPDLIIRAAPLLLAAWFLFVLRMAQRRDPFKQSSAPLIAAGVLIAFLVARSPASRHFLILSPVMVLAVIQVCRNSALHRAIMIAAVLVGILFAFPQRLSAQVAIRTRSAERLKELSSLIKDKYGNCFVTILEDAAIQPLTLFSGSRAAPRRLFSDELSRLYPQFAFVRSGSNVFRTYGRVLSDSAWAAAAFHYSCRVFVGNAKTAEDHFREVLKADPKILDVAGNPPHLMILGMSKDTENRFKLLVPNQSKGRVPRRNSP